MKNHSNPYGDMRHRKLHLQINAMLWWFVFTQTIIYSILIDKMNWGKWASN